MKSIERNNVWTNVKACRCLCSQEWIMVDSRALVGEKKNNCQSCNVVFMTVRFTLRLSTEEQKTVEVE